MNADRVRGAVPASLEVPPPAVGEEAVLIDGLRTGGDLVALVRARRPA